MANHRGVRRAVPLAVAAGLAWLMVGCVYLPWFEQAKLTGTTRDFRDPTRLIGGGGDPFDGHVTNDEVVRLLGPPAVESPNGRVFVYTMTTQHGVWVEPLCLYTTPGGRRVYALGLRFDDHGVLEGHRVVDVEVNPALVTFKNLTAEGEAGWALQSALKQIDRANGVPPAPDRPYKWDGTDPVQQARESAVTPNRPFGTH